MEIGLWLSAWESVEGRYKTAGTDVLTEDELLWLTLRHTIDDVENNGILGLFCADAPPGTVALLNAWHSIGAEDMYNVFERAVALLPNGLPPEGDDGREELIALWQDDAYSELLSELEDDFYELLPEAEALLDEVVKRVLEAHE